MVKVAHEQLMPDSIEPPTPARQQLLVIGWWRRHPEHSLP
jgi:hypothetical protein